MFDALYTSALNHYPAHGIAIVLAILLGIILMVIATSWLIGLIPRQSAPQMPEDWKNVDPFKDW